MLSGGWIVGAWLALAAQEALDRRAPAGSGQGPVAPASEAGPAAEPVEYSKFVFINTYALSFGLTYIPALDITAFLGGRLPTRPLHPGNWLALGYQGTLSGGGVLVGDLYWFAHRHHLALHGVAGLHGRLAYGASFGVVGLHGYDRPHGGDPSLGSGGATRAFGLEGEVRLGVASRRHPKLRSHGVFGFLMRISGAFASESSVLPTFGLFAGFVFPPIPRR